MSESCWYVAEQLEYKFWVLSNNNTVCNSNAWDLLNLHPEWQLTLMQILAAQSFALHFWLCLVCPHFQLVNTFFSGMGVCLPSPLHFNIVLYSYCKWQRSSVFFFLSFFWCSGAAPELKLKEKMPESNLKISWGALYKMPTTFLATAVRYWLQFIILIVDLQK